MQKPEIQRRRTRKVRVGPMYIGGDAPVSVQSMTKTETADVEATVAQVQALAAAGAEIVRVAAATKDDTAALRQIVARSPVPIVADVHFHFERALEAIEAGAAKIRLNPGNIKDRKGVFRVIAAAADAGAAIRVGVNEGSVVERADGDKRKADLSRPLDDLMVEKLAEYLEVFAEANFHNLVLSAKSHDAYTCVSAYRKIAKRWDYPLHLGVTHAGTAGSGAIRSAAAMGALLSEGIGDTIRISYAGDPLGEVSAALELLYSLRLRRRRGAEIIACPTCSRSGMDVEAVAEEVRLALTGIDAPITVAVMGCVVNGPGEAAEADLAVCAGEGKAILYRRGEIIGTIPSDMVVSRLVSQARRMAKDA